MTEEIRTKLNDLGIYIYDVIEVFKEYFGEERVDATAYPSLPSLENESSLNTDDITDIVVHFPKVTVTNEREESIDIYDLFARTSVYNSGKLAVRPMMRKTTYTQEQLNVGYSHSHLPRNSFDWANPCLGSGPINSTIASLFAGNDMDSWRLYCLELDRYVQVESLSGGPYILMSCVTRYSLGDYIKFNYNINQLWQRPLRSYSEFPEDIAENEILARLFKKGMLNFTYSSVEGYRIAETPQRLVLLISNVCIEIAQELGWSRQDILQKGLCIESIYSGGHFYRVGSSIRREFAEGEVAFTFRGKNVLYKLIGQDESPENKPVLIVTRDEFTSILELINILLNNVYGNKIKTDKPIRII